MGYVDNNEFLKNELELFEYLINRTRTELKKKRYFGIKVYSNTTLKGMIDAIEKREAKQRTYTVIIATDKTYKKIQQLGLRNYLTIERANKVNVAFDLKKLIETNFPFLKGEVISFFYPTAQYYSYYGIDKPYEHENGGYGYYRYYKSRTTYKYEWNLNGKTQAEFNQLKVKNEDLIIVNYAVMEKR